MKHELIITGKMKGHGKNRVNRILYQGYIAYDYRIQAKLAMLNWLKLQREYEVTDDNR